MRIRKATLKDAQAVLRLLNQSNRLRGDDDIGYDLRDVKGYIRDKRAKFYVCEIDNKIIGFFYAIFFDTYISFNLIGIDRKYQGKGVGTQLVNFLEKLAKKYKKPFIELMTEVDNEKSQALFKKLKYKRGKKFYYFFKKLK